MKHLKVDWKKRSLIILAVSFVFCLLFWTISFTDWAITLNNNPPEPHVQEEMPSVLAMSIASIVKVFVLTLVPALLCVGLLNIKNKFKKRKKEKQSQ